MQIHLQAAATAACIQLSRFTAQSKAAQLQAFSRRMLLHCARSSAAQQINSAKQGRGDHFKQRE